MAHRTVAEELVDMFANAGAERVYGVVGNSLNPVTDAIRRSGSDPLLASGLMVLG